MDSSYQGMSRNSDRTTPNDHEDKDEEGLLHMSLPETKGACSNFLTTRPYSWAKFLNLKFLLNIASMSFYVF